MDITQAATNSARYEHLIALKCTAEAKAKAAETRVGKKSQPNPAEPTVAETFGHL